MVRAVYLVLYKYDIKSGVPKECASHIYFEINPDERSKGYGGGRVEISAS